MSIWPDTISTDNALIAKLKAAPPQEGLPEGWLAQWDDVWCPLAASLAGLIERSEVPPVIGIHGGQGSGKSTLSQALKQAYANAFGWNAVIVSIDDLYLSHAERQQLSLEVHPLLATRGVPGTHEVDRGIQLFDQLRHLSAGEHCQIPAFDKASDDRLPETQWHSVEGPVDVILFEGWCVGCEAVSDQQLEIPINTLEAEEDPDATWRTWVNTRLANEYRTWFSEIDYLIMLKVPDMAAVQRWRTQQEAGNRSNAQGTTDRSLDSAALRRFIQHYERITLQALTRLPEIANLVMTINDAHQVAAITEGNAGS